MENVKPAIPGAAVRTQQYEPGSIGRRAAANMIDGAIGTVIKLPISIGLMLIFGVTAVLATDPKAPVNPLYTAVNFAFSVAFFYLYYGWFNLNKGATPGKLIMGLRVANAEDGTRIGYGRSFAREVTKIIGLLLLLIGAFIAIFRKDKRGLHDLVCNTKVLHVKQEA